MSVRYQLNITMTMTSRVKCRTQYATLRNTWQSLIKNRKGEITCFLPEEETECVSELYVYSPEIRAVTSQVTYNMQTDARKQK